MRDGCTGLSIERNSLSGNYLRCKVERFSPELRLSQQKPIFVLLTGERKESGHVLLNL